MSISHRLVATAAATALALPILAVAASSAAGMPIPLPDPKPALHLEAAPLDAGTAVLIELQSLRDEYAATRLPRLHNAVVLILNSPACAVL
jgi:hypothetical protein